jgi:hypothetical protein
MGFDKPTSTKSSGDFFIVNEHVGVLIVFKVLGQKPDYSTERFGVKPTVWADVMLVDGPNAGTVFPRAEIFHTKLYEALFEHVGKNVLARLNKGNRAFFLNDATPDEERYAEEFLANGGRPAATQAAGDPWDPGARETPPSSGGNPFDAPDEPPF